MVSKKLLQERTARNITIEGLLGGSDYLISR